LRGAGVVGTIVDVFRPRRQSAEIPDVITILTWLMRLDAKLDRIELLVIGEDPDDQ
jgi:hypothetical protein